MKNASVCVLVLIVVSFMVISCSSPAPTTSAPEIESEATAEPSAEPIIETAAPTQTAIPVPSPTPTTHPLQLEVIQSQVWTDRDGNTRVNVLLHNPYDFPVAPTFRANAELVNAAGQITELQELYFLDGISGGNGFFLPGETVPANACFNCEEAPITEEWTSVQFESVIEDATDKWNYYTDVEATVTGVSFDGDNPLFQVSGTVKNNTDSVLQRISARVVVFDQQGNLVGTAEVSSWDVAPGATVNFSGMGIGLAPEGSVTYEVTALGVKY